MNTPTLTAPRLEPPAPRPGLWPAFRGCWYLLWKSQLQPARLPGILATILTIPLVAYLTTDESRRTPYLHWYVSFYLQLVLPLTCLTMFGDLMRSELQANTLHFLTTRPVTRAQLFLGKFVGQMIWMQALGALTAGCFVLAGWLRGIPGALGFTGVFLLTQFFAILAYGALSALFGLIHKRYLVLGTLYGFVVEVGVGQIPSNINSLAITRHLKTLLAWNEDLATRFDWSSSGLWFAVLSLCVGTVVYSGLAAFLFSVKEFHANEEMQK